MRSRCGFYLVARGMRHGRYIPYVTKGYGSRARMIGESRDSATEAMEVCQRHANDNDNEKARK